MSSVVEYILSLKSNQFEAGIASADRSTNALESSMGNLRNSVLGFVGAFASFEFLSGSVTMFNDAAQASAQLDASLKSTANAANLNREALDKQSEALMNKSLYDDDAITSSQALLATFTQVKDKIYMDAIPAIVDMSTKMGGDLQGATIQVGKALNDPIKGISALSRVGVTFSESQKATIKTMVETNDVAGAQSLILAELTKEFGGSAEAASLAGTGPFTVLQNQFGNVREEIGALVVAFANDFKPEIESLIISIGNIVRWVSEHKEGIKGLLVAYGTYQAAMMILVPLVEGYAAATATATVATEGFAIASTAALGPIGLLAVALGAIAYIWYDIANAEEQALARQQEYAKEYGNTTTRDLEAQLALHTKKGENEVEWRKRIADANRTMAEKDLAQAEDDLARSVARRTSLKEGGYTSASEDMDAGIFELQGKVAKFKAEIEATNQFANAGNTKAFATATKAQALPTASKAQVRPVASNLTNSQGTGSKSITFNIQINDLVKNFTVNATTIRESAKNIHDLVTGALTGAVNDFQRAIPE